MDWFAYFRLAQEWAEEEGPAHKRSAVSRAYYAMYCTARDKLADAERFNPPEHVSKHVYVWNLYKEDCEYPERKNIGVLGDRLRRARLKADYCGFIDRLPELVEFAMDDAKELKDELEALVM